MAIHNIHPKKDFRDKILPLIDSKNCKGKNIFRRIKCGNYWGNLKFFVGDNEINRYNCGRLVVQWPNGVKEDVVLTWKESYVTIFDMGHNYQVVQIYPIIKKDVNGIIIDIDLNDKFKVKFI